VSTSDFYASAYREFKDGSALFWKHALQATFFARTASPPKGDVCVIICHTVSFQATSGV